MSNLAVAQESVVVPFPKKEQQAMKQEGYSPLPNFLVDDRYFAELPDQSGVLLVVLNRHLNQKGNPKAFTISLAQDLAGFKDNRTAEKYLKTLVDWRLVKVTKARGKSSVYELDFSNPKPTQHLLNKKAPTQHVGTPPTQHVGASCVPTLQVPTSDVGTLPTQHVGTPPTCHVGLIKISNKDSNKEVEEARENFQASPAVLQFTEYHNTDLQRRTLKELASVYPIASDFMAQAKANFPKLTQEQIQAELKKLGRWSLTAEGKTAQKWMVTWLNWLDKLVLPTGEVKPQAKNKNQIIKRDVNTAWKQQQVDHVPVVDDVDLGGML